MIQLTFTQVKMTTAQVVETSVTLTDSSKQFYSRVNLPSLRTLTYFGLRGAKTGSTSVFGG